VRRLGTVGYIAKGLVIASAGGRWSSSRRVVRSPTRPPDSTGPSKHLGPNSTEQHYLTAAGLRIITYGLYSFAMARYTKM
jgi:hypothetical protein